MDKYFYLAYQAYKDAGLNVDYFIDIYEKEKNPVFL